MILSSEPVEDLDGQRLTLWVVLCSCGCQFEFVDLPGIVPTLVICPECGEQVRHATASEN